LTPGPNRKRRFSKTTLRIWQIRPHIPPPPARSPPLARSSLSPLSLPVLLAAPPPASALFDPPSSPGRQRTRDEPRRRRHCRRIRPPVSPFSRAQVSPPPPEPFAVCDSWNGWICPPRVLEPPPVDGGGTSADTHVLARLALGAIQPRAVFFCAEGFIIIFFNS
jgi:hypothetical protein